MPRSRLGALAPASLALAFLLAACGGGGSDTSTRAEITAVKVMGDSLADVGTFGIKFTIQGNPTYPDLVARQFGVDDGCPFFVFTGTTFAPNPKTGCTNFAIGGGVINGAGSGYSAADPRGVGVQLATAATVGYAAGDLLLIDGGGNDAAALVSAYLKASSDGGAAYVGVLSTVLTPEQVAAAVAGGQTGLATAGGSYMVGLADMFYNMVKAQALDKGAKRVALINIPGITNTPRFQMVLDGIAAAFGGGETGAAARAQSEALFKSWIEAFNARLASKVAGDERIALVDIYTSFNDEIANPAQYQLSNVKDTACPITGMGSDGLPTYTFATCTDANLAANPPDGLTGADWYKKYLFSDGFHPTPYGHQLASQLIARTLAQAGWL
ncbi:phospholipase [Ideonella sp. 4Y16]|uniref:Phospholipase n=1 Tax=Ideonella alba TaxID=2824118 RepID=A0A941BDA4_9BURK|nr:SGNH/GDSL hydrolase family protein [Ideonella alba]MBQ0930016.1 phospholipase [Ideonella alba]MBQ0946076.1 phospholipase [Ideonella alba]